MSTKNKVLTIDVLEKASKTLRLLAHPHRLKIIEMLENETEGLPVHSLTNELGIPQTTVSQHLRAMQRTGLLKSTRKQKEVWYSIDDRRALSILNCVRGGTK
jgi:DNA-binding transcriptional ArsR family regulator